MRGGAIAGFAGGLVFLSTVAGADHYTGPPSDFTAYWAVPAFADFPPKGPQAAKGVIFWSHGVSGKNPQYHVHPPELMRFAARTGWDIIKIQRNNLHEAGWSTSGTRHVADLVQRVAEAKKQGYRAVVAAGQSYGGIVSLEAGALTTDLHAVLAFAPGHGSDAREVSSSRRFDMLAGMLMDVVGKQKGGRVVVMIAEGDDLHPFDIRGGRLRETLSRLNLPFVQFDETMPIKGHGAVSTSQFITWYARCLGDFIDPAKTPPVGETACKAPQPAPTFILPGNLAVKPPTPDMPLALARISGEWSGRWPDNAPAGEAGREVCLVIEQMSAKEATFIFASGAGPRRDKSMFATRRTATASDDGGFFAGGEKNTEVRIAPAKSGEAIEFSVVSVNRQNRFAATLTRGCPK